MPQVNNKRVLKNTFYLYVRMLLSLLVSLYTARVILQVLGVVDYGLNDVVGGVVTFFAFIQGSLGASTSRFLSYALGRGDSSVLGKTFSNAFLIHFLFAIVVVLLGESIGIFLVNHILNIPAERLFACNVLWQFVVFGSFLSIVQVPLSALVISYERMNVFAFIGIFDVFARLVIVFLVSYSPFDKLISLGALNFCVSVIDLSIYFTYSKCSFPDVVVVSFKRDPEISKSMMGFTGWSIVGSLANVLRHSGLNVLLNIFFGPMANAANAIAFRVNNAVLNFTSSFTTAVNPQITKSYAAGEFYDMKKLIFSSGKITYYMLMLLCFPILFECDFILKLWLGHGVPEQAPLLTRLVLIISMLETYTYSIGCAVQATGRIRDYQLVISGICLLIFPISWVLFKLGFPLYTGLVVYLFCCVLSLVARMPFLKKLLNIPPGEYVKQVFVRTGAVSIVSFFPPLVCVRYMGESLGRFIFVVMIALFSTSLSICFLGLNSDEKKMIKKFIYERMHRR